MKILKSLIFTAVAGLAVFASQSVLAQQTTITVATDSDTAPYTYREKSAYKGYDIDVLKAVFKDSKDYKLSFQTVGFSSILTGVDAGRYQIAANAFNYNDERAKKYLFSDAVSKSNYAIVSKSGTSYKSLDDLAGKTTEAMAGSNYAQILEDYNQSHSDNPITINYVSNQAGLGSRLQNIESGKIDFILYDQISAAYVVKDQDLNLSVTKVTASLDENDKSGLEYFLFAKTDEGKALQKFVNKRLKALKKDGTLKKLSQKYFGGDYVSDMD